MFPLFFHLWVLAVEGLLLVIENLLPKSQLTNLFIMILNSSKSISPLPSSSASFINSHHMASSTSYFFTPNTCFNSSIDIDPLPSLSKNQKAFLSFSSEIKFFLLTVATNHSEQSISPLPSISAVLIILSTSSSANSPYIFVYPSISSSLDNFPSLLVSNAQNMSLALYVSSLDTSCPMMYVSTAYCIF